MNDLLEVFFFFPLSLLKLHEEEGQIIESVFSGSLHLLHHKHQWAEGA